MAYPVPANLTVPEKPPQWNSAGMFQLPSWAEPMIVLSILCSSMILTRRKGFSILGWPAYGYRRMPLDESDADSARSSDELLFYDSGKDEDPQDLSTASKRSPRKRKVCGIVLETPNTSRFANNIHSRLLQKFPFLVEMFYWILTFLLYRMTKVVSQAIFSKNIWKIAEENGINILEFEQFGCFRFLFPVPEHDVQHWFMNEHQTALTFLNRAYALVHIPGTVGFIAWYYYVAPNHGTFANVRRTLTLTNLFAFLTFTLYPCMPPRLLPKEYGFRDTVRHDNAQSIWMSGDFVNSLAAMPSMHFGYAFVIGCTMIHHSGVFRTQLADGEVRKSVFWKAWYLLIAFAYPVLVLVAIIATANHYWLDVLFAIFVADLAFLCNTIFLMFLPAEDILLWALRLEKPTPSTGERFRSTRAGW